MNDKIEYMAEVSKVFDTVKNGNKEEKLKAIITLHNLFSAPLCTLTGFITMGINDLEGIL